ncbi:MAG: hybrid sensor histidine kinase/response regulator [Symploca sp. SIO2B6]|nr:hybrid sensor histidine kinase/response regulator [Symploca sp. SIO2B6]
MVSDFKSQESYQFFLQEARELLQALEEGLLNLRKDSSISKVHDLMRIAHSLKGGAVCVGLNSIGTLAHSLENVFQILYEKNTDIDLELENLLLQAYDCLQLPLLEESQTGTFDGDSAIAKAQPIFANLHSKLALNHHQNHLLSHSQTDVTEFLFIEEVSEGLERLELILANPLKAEMVVALKAQIEIFKGLGKLSNLPGFVAIAQTTLAALEANREELIASIGEVALADFRAAQQGILKGNRYPGGKPSQQLLNFLPYPLVEANSELVSPLEVTQEQMQSRTINPQQGSDEAEKFSPIVLSDVLSDYSRLSQLPKETDAKFLSIPQPIAANNNKLGEDKTYVYSTSPPPKPLPLAVRMDLNRLELLNNLVSQLESQDNRLLLQNQQQVETYQALRQWFNRFEQVAQNLQLVVKHICLRSQISSRNPINSLSASLTNLSLPLLPKKIYQHLETTAGEVTEELSQLGEIIQDLALLNQRLQYNLKQRQKTLKQVQTNLLQTRMLPIGELLNQFSRMVRDLASKENKLVNLELSGTETLVDKAVLEKLYEPLVHLVRNAFDHGIEMPEVRQFLGKPAQGNIKIKAYYRGNQTYIEVQDDGSGIDLEKVKNTAVGMNLLSVSEAANVPENRLYELLFSPSFTTAEQVSQLSGRGMGLEAVKLQIAALKGAITVKSKFREGTTFTLRLPITFTIVKLLIFSLNDQLLAIPVDALVSITFADQGQIETQQQQQFYRNQEQLVPLFPNSWLSRYRYPRPINANQSRSMIVKPTSQRFPLLILSEGNQVIAIKIDQILIERDLGIKPFNEALKPSPLLCGCTILSDGQIVPVIDAPALVEKCLQIPEPPATIAPNLTTPLTIPKVPTVLVVDDSLTIRQTLYLTLGKAGYRVIQARDGWEAIGQLQQNSGIDAIICDIEMPRMNGLEFLSRCSLLMEENIPVLMLTSRNSQKYRQLAQQLGATSYLTKPYLDKDLLNALKTCVKN